VTDQHFKPYPKGTTKRKRQNRDAWQILRERVLKLDRICVVCKQRPSESVHHVVPKDFSGDDVAHNLVGVCGTGTTRCHGLLESRDPWACDALRERLFNVKPMILRYVLDTVGQPWFDDRYPPLGGPDAAGSTERGEAPKTGGKGEGAPTPRSNFFGKPLPGWLPPEDVEAAYRDCLEILQKQAEAGVAPLARKGGGEAGSALLLIFDDFRDRHSEWLRKGAA
jgi:hypothetical protein